ncbi:DUF6843 domain-containing protein [Bacillus sp. CGMCC 1.16607]|uniref:DUF6843 domain-containing protein n=1 Tax=Bacillus sp. CGMCC 1.16607 TaxID=3351842 RepID=UPI0036354F4D
MKRKFFAINLTFFALVGCTFNGETNDIYLIPEGYEGNVYAFYNVKGAPEIKKEGKYDIYDINNEGFYVTSTADMDYGTVTDKYYYVDKNGNRTKISEECIRGMGTGGFENDPNSVDKIKINYTGIEITKESCGQEFIQSGNGMNSEDSQSVLETVVKRYYGVDLFN